MKIGIDARAALLKKKGGFGVYARNLIQSMIDLYPDYYFDLTHCNDPEDLLKTYKNIQYLQLKFPIKSLGLNYDYLSILKEKNRIFFYFHIKL